MTGNYTMQNAGRLVIDVANATSDLVAVGVNATLNGTLQVGTLPGHTHSAGISTDAITFANRGTQVVGVNQTVPSDFLTKLVDVSGNRFEPRYGNLTTTTYQFATAGVLFSGNMVANPDANMSTDSSRKPATRLSLVQGSNVVSNLTVTSWVPNSSLPGGGSWANPAAQIGIRAGGFVYRGNVGGKAVFERMVELVNLTGAAINGPIYLAIQQQGANPLPLLYNKQGGTLFFPSANPQGDKQYVVVQSHGASLAAGAKTAVSLKFMSTSSALIASFLYDTLVLQGGVP
jgi:hypothetical protein